MALDLLIILLVLLALGEAVQVLNVFRPIRAPDPPPKERWDEMMELLRGMAERPSAPGLPPPAPAPSGDGVMLVRFPSLQPIGARHPAHPDVDEALRTPGLALLHSDGRVDEGFQGDES
jgi:hypothetical protein